MRKETAEIGYSGLGKHSRSYPLEGYKQETYTDEKVHVTLAIAQKDHLAICQKLPGLKMNRTEWIQQAIAEKLARDNEQQ